METNFDITVAQLKDLLESGDAINLVDVREEHEYEEDNIGARLIPLSELSSRLDDFEEYRGKDIYVHCRSGARSGRAKEFLLANGFDKVHNVLGGILAYRQLEV